MFPTIFTWLATDSTVTALIGSGPTRCYRHGFAPQGVNAPYVTWFVVSGSPENNLSDTPPTDRYTIQLDCWSNNSGTGAAEVEQLATAVRDALEQHGHLTGIPVNTKDPETNRYRIGLQFDFWLNRPESTSS